MTNTKKILIAMMVLGAISLYGGSSGTFASFNAQATNAGSSISSGTLTLSDSAGAGCVTITANSANNNNAACPAVLSLTNVAPGVDTGSQVGSLVITNTGSLPASKMFVFAPYPNANLSAAASGTAVTSLTVSAVEGQMASGNTVSLSYGSLTSVTCTLSAAVAPGATTIPVNSCNLGSGVTWPINTVVQDTSGDTSTANEDCYDAKTTTTPVSGATTGTTLNFNPTTGNPLCSQLDMFIQEQTGSYNYCWYGNTSDAPTGACTAPIYVTSTTASYSVPTTATATSLAVGALNGNIASGDSITLTQSTSSNTDTCNAAAAAYYGSTSISLNNCSTDATAFTTGTVVTDTSTQNQLDSDTSHTLQNFDTGHNGTSGQVQLYPLSANNTDVTNGSVNALAAQGTRTFIVGVFLPSGTGLGTNAVQGLMSTFGLSWQLQQ